MKHAEIINNAYNFTKNAFFSITQFPRWVVLFLYIVGAIAATITLQLLLLPSLVNLLVGPSFCLTCEALSGLLQYLSFLIGLAGVFFVPLLQGYCYHLFKNSNSMPETGNTWDLFFKGWRINITILIYAIPLIIISVVYMLIFIYLFPDTDMSSSARIHDLEGTVYAAAVFSYTAVQFTTTQIGLLFAFVGITHLCKTGSISEAVSLKTISGIISRIGWYDYILSLVIMNILYLMVTVVMVSFFQLFAPNLIIMTALYVLYIFALMPMTVFFIKYLSGIYDTAFLPEKNDDEEYDFF
ncbi:MAG: DUF4013 domain-containing protein [Methanocalculaceae archaeon]|jgi:hypothetical protein|nr:DUF4013 domain-containing protein [Methanocalculaceae archaeon]